MTNVDERLRELLERKAGEVPPRPGIPPTLRPRARRRIALNGVVALAVVVALGGGAVGVLSTFDRAGVSEVGGGPKATAAPAVSASSEPSSSAPASSSLPACTAGQLRVDAQLDGAMGSLGGALLLSNYSSTTCTLQGRPTITLLTPKHRVISDVDVVATAPYWKVNRLAKPAGWPVVKLRPGAVAMVRLRWSNWCGKAIPLWQIGVPGGGTTWVYGIDGYGPPPCNGQGQPTLIEIGPFEPQA
jgi:hypothetical protein